MADVLSALKTASNSIRTLTPALDTGYGPTASQGQYIGAGSAQIAGQQTYNTQAPYVNPEQVQAGMGQPGSTTGVTTTQRNPISQPNNYSLYTPTGAVQNTNVPAPSAPSSQQDAQKIIDDMNAGRIQWDDNARAKANAVLNPPDNNPIGEEGVRDIMRGIAGATDADFAKIDMSKYANESRSRASAIAAEIEGTLKANAEAEYRDTMAALGAQKGEVTTLSEQQKGNITKQKELTEAELLAKKESETKNIGAQSDAFAEEVTDQKEVLARNWRDLSLRTQAIMRSRGVSESSYASDKESALMLDFNKGLRQLSKSSSDALASFSDALIETDKFYTRQAAQLDFDVQKQNQDVDNWVRQQVQNIQAQENKAMSSKLAEIRSAILQGNQIKYDTETRIATQKEALDTWLIQTQINYKMAVATAAQGKVQSAVDSIADSAKYGKATQDIINSGGQFVKDASGKIYIQDLKGSMYPSTSQAYDVYMKGQQEDAVGNVLKEQAAKLAIQTDPSLVARFPELANLVPQAPASNGTWLSRIFGQ